LRDLTDGQSYVVYVKGKNSANVWQSHPDYAVSKSWKIDRSYINEPDLPKQFFLHQNVPNPFNVSTDIRFDVPKDSEIKVTIYNLLGNRVRTLADGFFKAGNLDFVWNAQTDDGLSVSTGLYIVRVQAGHKFFTMKMVLIK